MTALFLRRRWKASAISATRPALLQISAQGDFGRSGHLVIRLPDLGVRVRRPQEGSLDVPLAAIDGGPPACSPPRFHDLGRLGGAVLGFTAAAVGRSGRIFDVAAAEHTPDPVSDGPVADAALGVIDGDVVRWTPLLEEDGTLSRRKPEGLLLDASEREGWLVTDPDDAEEPAHLLRFRLDGLW